MLLALWAGFAGTWGVTSTSTSAVPIVVPDSSLASGGKGRPNNTYQMLPEDYWEIREASITGNMPKEPDTTPIRVSSPQRDELLAAIRNAASLDELRENSARLKQYDGTA
jgi:hypothetical protein